MGKAKTWSADEAEAAAKAFVIATHDSVHGSGKRGEDLDMKPSLVIHHLGLMVWAPTMIEILE
jgi:hypothetical protein